MAEPTRATRFADNGRRRYRDAMEAAFELVGATAPLTPVILSVPHAGRRYPPSVAAALRAPAAALVNLEDRHVDAVAQAARRDETAVIQRHGRAWIDLNRREDERDPRVDDGAMPIAGGGGGLKLRSGLGLVPRRAAGCDMIWRHRFSGAEIEQRIACDHRPYHAALAELLTAARGRFGTAVLVDLHSMPPLGAGGAQVVIGDRFGRSAGGSFTAQAEQAARAAGLRVALNTPYAGGHILDRHGDPARGIHAIQIEIDRSLYLDAQLDQPSHGLGAVATVVRAILDALADEAHRPLANAAE